MELHRTLDSATLESVGFTKSRRSRSRSRRGCSESDESCAELPRLSEATIAPAVHVTSSRGRHNGTWRRPLADNAKQGPNVSDLKARLGLKKQGVDPLLPGPGPAAPFPGGPPGMAAPCRVVCRFPQRSRDRLPPPQEARSPSRLHRALRLRQKPLCRRLSHAAIPTLRSRRLWLRTCRVLWPRRASAG